ncbi:MAG: hypothetical protein ACE5JO_10010 [Candidatus Binatia bacterium]
MMRDSVVPVGGRCIFTLILLLLPIASPAQEVENRHRFGVFLGRFGGLEYQLQVSQRISVGIDYGTKVMPERVNVFVQEEGRSVLETSLFYRLWESSAEMLSLWGIAGGGVQWEEGFQAFGLPRTTTPVVHVGLRLTYQPQPWLALDLTHRYDEDFRESFIPGHASRIVTFDLRIGASVAF